MTPETASNRTLLMDTIKKVGSKRLSFDEKDIEMLSNSKSFNLVDYLKKMVVLNRVTDIDSQLSIESDLTQEYNDFLVERNEIEENGVDLEKNKRYQNIKAKTDYGLPFYLMQGYFQPKTLNKISKQNPKIVYKLDNEIERRAKRSRYFKTDPERATANATVNVFRDEFPKADTQGLSKATLTMNNSGMTVSKVAAKTINSLCENGILSGLVNKLTDRIGAFTKKIGVKSDNKWIEGTKNVMKYAASAAAVAILGNEAIDLISTPMPPLAEFGVMETLEVLAGVDVSHSKELIPNDLSTLSNDVMNVKGINLESLNIAANGISDISQEDQSILDIIVDKQEVVQMAKDMTLEGLASEHLSNPTIEEIQHFVSAVSEYNDIDNPNVILDNEDILIPTKEFTDSFVSNTFEITATNKKEIFEQMKDVTINYGETQSQLVEKLSEGLRDIGGYKAQQITAFQSELKEVIPVDLKAFDTSVTENIKDVVDKFEKLTNKSSLKFR